MVRPVSATTACRSRYLAVAIVASPSGAEPESLIDGVRFRISDLERIRVDQRQLFLPVAVVAMGRSREHPRSV